MELDQQYTIEQTHNLFLNKFIDNQQAKTVHLMKLETHRTLYTGGTQCKYLTNLVVAGRNFIQLYAIFQNQVTLSMGCHSIFEDIRLVKQWEKNIVVQVGSNKIIGLIYEDSIIKNSFMISLQFLQLGPNEQIDIICDKLGYYMLITSAREMLLCVSQKTIQKYKAKPLYHRNSTLVNEDIKWNRPQYQSVADVIRIQLYDFQISKVQCFNFCDDKLYFIGHSSKSNNQKYLLYIACSIIFSENENQPLLMNLTPQPSSVKQIHPIHRGKQSQYVIVRKDGSIQLQSQKGTIFIEKKTFKESSSQILLYFSPQTIFPFYALQDNILYIYRRDSGYETTSITTASQIYKTQMKLPSKVDVCEFDIREYFFVYCNAYEVGIFNFQGFEEEISQGPKIRQNNENRKQPFKNILKQSFGSIVDFNFGRNLMIVQNYFENSCRLNLLSKSIREDPRSFVTHPKKNSLECISKTINIKSLVRELKDEVSNKPEHNQIIRRIAQLLIITSNERKMFLYKLDQKGSELLAQQFDYYTVIKESYLEYSQVDCWNIVLWHKTQNRLSFYDFCKADSSLLKKRDIEDVDLEFTTGGDAHRIFNFREFIIQPQLIESKLFLYGYNMRQKSKFKIMLVSNEDSRINQKCKIQIIRKNLTFKKKDKDIFLLEVLAITQKNQLLIWEVSPLTQICRLAHKTQQVGEGLPILFYTHYSSDQFPSLVSSNRFRALTCPQYIIQTQNTRSMLYMNPTVLKMAVYEHQGQSFLLLINSNKNLLIYKKYYNSQLSTNAQHLGSSPNIANPQILHSDIGFLYHREKIQLNILKKWEYQQKTAFVELGEGILRVCNFAFYRNQLFQISQDIRSCFTMDDQVWGLQSNGKIKMLITKGRIVSHFLVTEIPTSIKSNILGLDATNQIYAVYQPKGFEVLNKDPMVVWRSNPNQFSNRQKIIALCAFQHYIVVSYYNYAVSQENNDEFQSIKFKIRIYNTFLKSKIIEKQMPLEEPALFINHIPPDKILIVTPSNVFVYAMKNERTLQSLRRKNYSKRNMLASFSYIPQKSGVEPGYMIFGGNYGGLNFMVGQWIDRQKLDQIWFQSIKCSIKQLEIFHYGEKSDFLKSLVADNEGNIIVLNLTPKKADKLADFHIGSIVTKIKKRNQIPYIASKDGCINLLIPIKLKNIDVSFLDFQEQFLKQIPLLGGLNTRQSRCLQQKYRTYKITSIGNIVDSEIFKQFLAMTETLQNHLFQKIDMQMVDIKSELLKQL